MKIPSQSSAKDALSTPMSKSPETWDEEKEPETSQTHLIYDPLRTPHITVKTAEHEQFPGLSTPP